MTLSCFGSDSIPIARSCLTPIPPTITTTPARSVIPRRRIADAEIVAAHVEVVGGRGVHEPLRIRVGIAVTVHQSMRQRFRCHHAHANRGASGEPAKNST